MKALVIGHGGLIGSAVVRALQESVPIFLPKDRINWKASESALSDLRKVCTDFFEFVGDGQWLIFWAAGKGHLGSAATEMISEEQLFEEATRLIADWTNSDGVFVFASSAGAVWSGSAQSGISESTADSGTSPYALSKLRQESLLLNLCEKTQIRGVSARIGSVYGINQDLQKPQGLISRLCVASIRRHPAEIFVPLETTRNYIFADDAAAMMVGIAYKYLLSDEFRGRSTRRVICSRDNHSIATICKSVESVARRRLLLSSRITQNSDRYPLHFLLRTDYPSEVSCFESTTLLAGISAVYQEMVRTCQSGHLVLTPRR